MERVVRKVPRLVPSTTVYDEVERFIAKDGREFYTQKTAEDHERYLDEEDEFNKKFKLIKVNIDGDDYDVIEVGIVNKIARDAICKMYLHIYGGTIDRSGTYLISTDDSGDYTHQYVEYLDDMISETEEKLNQLKELKK